MNLVRISIISLLFMLIIGCSTKPTILYKTEYKEVKVPVIVKIDRPERPKYLSTDTNPSYLLKVLTYTKKLEVLIDEHNKKVN